MKRFASFTALLALLGLFGAACGKALPNPLGGTGGSDLTAGPGPSTSVGSSPTGSAMVSSGTGSATTGGGCKAGGTACEAFTECCSGTCAKQICTSCGNQGEPCADGCCGGLTCYQGKCGTCKGDDAACSLASECCSNICTQGTCAHCNADGDACAASVDCCGGACTNGTCGPCAGPTCKSVYEGTGDASKLCGKAADVIAVLTKCICEGACKPSCADSACVGQALSQGCTACLQNTSTGCGNELNDCLSN